MQQVVNRPQRRSKSCPSISRMHYTDGSYDPRYGLENWCITESSGCKLELRDKIPSQRRIITAAVLISPRHCVGTFCYTGVMMRWQLITHGKQMKRATLRLSTYKVEAIIPYIDHLPIWCTRSRHSQPKIDVRSQSYNQCPASHVINGIQVLCMYPS